jgi:hypothetical protein
MPDRSLIDSFKTVEDVPKNFVWVSSNTLKDIDDGKINSQGILELESHFHSLYNPNLALKDDKNLTNFHIGNFLTALRQKITQEVVRALIEDKLSTLGNYLPDAPREFGQKTILEIEQLLRFYPNDGFQERLNTQRARFEPKEAISPIEVQVELPQEAASSGEDDAKTADISEDEWLLLKNWLLENDSHWKKGDEDNSKSNLKEIEAMLNKVPETQLLEFLQKQKDNDGQTVLHYAIQNPELFELILLKVPEDQRLAALQTKNKDGNTVIHSALDHPESLHVILQLVGKDALQITATNQKTVLQAFEELPENKLISFKNILELLEPHKTVGQKTQTDPYEKLRKKINFAIPHVKLQQQLQSLQNLKSKNTFAANITKSLLNEEETIAPKSTPELSQENINIINEAMLNAIKACQNSRVDSSKKEKIELLENLKSCFENAPDEDKLKFFSKFIKTAAAARTNYIFALFPRGPTGSVMALQSSLRKFPELTTYTSSIATAPIPSPKSGRNP